MLQTRKIVDPLDPQHLDVGTLSVLAYFADDPDRVYQLVQWLPVLELLDAHEPVGIVVRDPDTATSSASRRRCRPAGRRRSPSSGTCTPSSTPRWRSTATTRCATSTRCSRHRMLHVHINHGESDKQSMASNNAKSYDRVFVAGEAAVQRHASRAARVRHSTGWSAIGRPQLDLHPRAGAVAERAAHRPLRADLGGRRRLQQLLRRSTPSDPRSCARSWPSPTYAWSTSRTPRSRPARTRRSATAHRAILRAGGAGRRPRARRRAPRASPSATSSP